MKQRWDFQDKLVDYKTSKAQSPKHNTQFINIHARFVKIEQNANLTFCEFCKL